MAAVLLKSLCDGGYQGSIYPINPAGGEFMGLPVYPRIGDVPGPVDYAFCFVPASLSPGFVDECVAKQVKIIGFYTAGFSETNETEGIQLEHDIVRRATDAGIRILGPNCIGVYDPSIGLSFTSDLPMESGPVGLFCQSGGHALYSLRSATARGVRFSKAISYGNACDINECDLLEYFMEDEGTRVIAAYIEGVRDGRRFRQLVKEAALRKPLVIFKGGRTQAGIRTAAGHTGSLAGSEAVWHSLMQQAGVIEVSSVEELIDVVLLLVHLSPVFDTRVGIIGLGGGSSTLAADACEDAGLSLPALPSDIVRKLKSSTPLAGNILTNPVDSQHFYVAPDQYADTLSLMAEWQGIDFLLFQLFLCGGPVPPIEEQERYRRFINVCLDFHAHNDKPTVLVLHSFDAVPAGEEVLRWAQDRCAEAGLLLYPSLSRAAKALRKFVLYHRARRDRA